MSTDIIAMSASAGWSLETRRCTAVWIMTKFGDHYAAKYLDGLGLTHGIVIG